MTGRRKRCARIAFSSRNTRFSRKLTEPGFAERFGGTCGLQPSRHVCAGGHFPSPGDDRSHLEASVPVFNVMRNSALFALRVHAWKTPWLVSSPRWVTVTRPGEASTLARCYGNTA